MPAPLAPCGPGRENRSCKQRRIEQAKGKQVRRPLSRDRFQRLSCLRRIADVREPAGIERGSAANDDEENDHHAGDAANEDVKTRVLVLPGSDSFFDETRLQIEKLPG